MKPSLESVAYLRSMSDERLYLVYRMVRRDYRSIPSLEDTVKVIDAELMRRAEEDQK